MAMLERRRIEAKLLAHVYAVLSETQGKETAAKVIGESVRRSAIEQGAEMAKALGGETSLKTFIEAQEAWTRGGALAVEVKEASDTRFAFHVTRCEYARMYREMGLGEIGHLLSCQRDGTFCEGYDPKLKMKRTQTIMQGADHCDFEYTYEAVTTKP
ncbi:MAG: L-2-amino-thiazoline-4-carboxylic acid hydrolase [Proteobacteria bacterium]|nr:L-2-amino-thiazoline-4-carboxylic acid hydrolase [Pseudomonadota bacterium]